MVAHRGVGLLPKGLTVNPKGREVINGAGKTKKRRYTTYVFGLSVIFAFFVKYWIILPVCVSNSYLNEIN